PSPASASEILSHRMYDMSTGTNGRRSGVNTVTIRAIALSPTRPSEQRRVGHLVERRQPAACHELRKELPVVGQPVLRVAVVEADRHEVVPRDEIERPTL